MPKIAITILLLFSTTRLFALGLGNIELNSALNQPFDARIELLSPTSAEIDSLSVRLADLEAFNRAGIERVFILASLQFEIEINDSGPDYIRITSSTAIREPFLNFLLEASWSSGRLFREYTVLLDPPLYDPNSRRISVPSAPVSVPESVSSSQSESTPPATSSSPVASLSGDDYGPISSDDTLWSIATRVRPDTDVTVQQMMLALLRANPEAFIENNINGLREGQILRIPDREDITSTSAEAALSQAQSQNSLWEEVRGSFAANVSQRPAGGSTTQPVSSSVSSNADTNDAELRLVSPGTDSSADAGQAAASFDSSGQGGADLALANEQLEALTSENSDLRGQLEESETLIQDLQRLLELRDDELATLQ
ncbi:MAG: LysM peptidoglycan-binding domain-containing protein, partial [Gammaproteobacteria bacterium]|nr:LysM peptidoglycan-binding domain-containing protein [Gammaproteobacteria bacterium]